MSVDYDPYGDAVMRDPHPVYRRLREESPVHYLAAYDCWALSRFEDVWNACLDAESFSAREGTAPGQILLRDPIPRTFMTMDMPEHRRWRGLVAPAYGRGAVAKLEPALRAHVRELLAPLVATGAFDVYRDLANRVAIHVGADLIGVDRAGAEEARVEIDALFHREPGQSRPSPENLARAGRAGALIAELVADRRRREAGQADHLGVWLRAEVDGQRLGEEDLAAYVYSFLVTSSEVVPLAVANSIVQLWDHPDQLAEVRRDRALVAHAFAESLRHDQPTNLLGRRVAREVEIRGRVLKPGQGVLFLWASANRDEAEFADADRFDLHRRPRRTLSYGHGIHKCIGEHLGALEGRVILEELFVACPAFVLERERVARLYGEFLAGTCACPIRCS